MHKFPLVLLVVALVAFVAASTSAVQSTFDQGGGITPGVGLDSVDVPSGGRKAKLRKSFP